MSIASSRRLQGPSGARFVPVFDRAAAVAAADGPLRTRIDSIRLLGLGNVDRALVVLTDLLDARQPSEVQLAALQTIEAVVLAHEPATDAWLRAQLGTLADGGRR